MRKLLVEVWPTFVAGGLLTLAAAGCGRGGGVTGPTSPPETTGAPPVAQRPVDLPRSLYGAFAASGDVPEVAANGGNVVLVVPTYADDARVVASALRANGKVAILSAHHVFSGSETTWEQGWAATKRWAEPFADLIGAIYVVDEPLSWGMPREAVERAIARVRTDGYRTMVAETAEMALKGWRPPVDLFGVTCYDWPGHGSRTLTQCREAYRSHPGWNVAIGQGFDWHARSGTPYAQVKAWAEIGRERDGVVFWVWDWPGQVGIRVDQGALAAYREGAGW
jgi:hypothetical protein